MTGLGVEAGGGPGEDGLRARVMRHRLARSMQGDGLRAKAMRGSGWTMFGFGAGQVLRLGSNLILARLLFPEVFGLMALASVFMTGLAMLSDIGVGPSIVQNKRGEDPDFLATAWTMQVIRGFTLFLAMCALAYPASLIYDEPVLFPLIIMIGFSAVISGFQSIGFSVARRNMALKNLTQIDLGVQLLSISATVMAAWIYPSVWSIVFGNLLGTCLRVAVGYRVLPSVANRFQFERNAARDIFRFGKWIFFGTALTYFGGQGLALIQGYFVSMEVLGMLSIAGMLGWSAGMLIQKLGGAVLFPSFATIYRERPETLSERLRESRRKIFLITFPVFALLILFGREIIHILYNDAYQQAGTFLVIMATGSAIATQRIPFGMTLIAVGDSKGHAINMAASSIFRITAVVTGYQTGGIIGMLFFDAIAMIAVYPIEASRLRRVGLWFPAFDCTVFLLYAALGCFSFFYGPFMI